MFLIILHTIKISILIHQLPAKKLLLQNPHSDLKKEVFYSKLFLKFYNKIGEAIRTFFRCSYFFIYFQCVLCFVSLFTFTVKLDKSFKISESEKQTTNYFFQRNITTNFNKCSVRIDRLTESLECPHTCRALNYKFKYIFNRVYW